MTKLNVSFQRDFHSCLYTPGQRIPFEENRSFYFEKSFLTESFIIMILRRVLSLISFLFVFSNSGSFGDELKAVPVGHLKPLGSHRPPETNLVDDLQEIPSAEEFWTKYVRPSKAVVLRGAAKLGRAFEQWTDQYLKDSFADLEVRLEAKKEKSSKVPIGAKGVGRDTIGKLIRLICPLLLRSLLIKSFTTEFKLKNTF